MEKGHRKDSMDTDQPEHEITPNRAPGSPSYSPPEYPESREEEVQVRSDDDEAEKVEAARRKGKSKGKGRASSLSSSEEEETEEVKAARRKAKGKGRASSPSEEDKENDEPPSPSPPTAAAQDTDMDVHMDMNDYWTREALNPTSDHETQFGHADATMNDELASQTSLDPVDDDAAPALHGDPPGRAKVRLLDKATLTIKLLRLQKQQLAGGGSSARGRGGGSSGSGIPRGKGWGLTWHETVLQSDANDQSWGQDHHPEPEEDDGEKGWEVYDPTIWDLATEPEAPPQPTPPPPRPPPPSSPFFAAGGEFVRAIRGYKAMFPTSHLSYATDDVMRVIRRHDDDKIFTLLPFKDRASPGRAHTKDFVPLERDGEGAEGRKGG